MKFQHKGMRSAFVCLVDFIVVCYIFHDRLQGHEIAASAILLLAIFLNEGVEYVRTHWKR